MDSELHYFRSTVRSAKTKSARDPKMPRQEDTRITFLHRKITGYRWVDSVAAAVYGPLETIGDEKRFIVLSDVKRLDNRAWYTKYMSEMLSSIHVPEDKKDDIIEELFQVIDEVAVPEHDIMVYALDMNVSILDMASSLPEGCLEQSLWSSPQLYPEDVRILQSMGATYEPRLRPTAISVIESLEKVKFDSLESSNRQMQCAICCQDLDHHSVEEGQGSNDHELMITRLPCLHLYHPDCIVQWLERNRACPLCRKRVRTVKKKPSRSRHWDMFMMAAVGILATCVGLQMIEMKSKVKLSKK